MKLWAFIRQLGVVVLLVASGFCGCETQPVALGDSKPAPPDHLLGLPKKVVSSIDLGGKVVITRDSGFAGSAGLLKIFVDGAPVAKLGRYERYEVLLSEGEHLLGVIPDSNLFGISVHETVVKVGRGQTCYFRVGLTAADGLTIQRSAFTQ
jgi:hypothetical protein